MSSSRKFQFAKDEKVTQCCHINLVQVRLSFRVKSWLGRAVGCLIGISHFNDLKAQDGSAGSILWEFNSRSVIVCTPSFSKDGNIYFASEDSVLHALDPDGRERWTYPARRVIRNPPVIGNDGTVYISALDGRLLVLTADGAE